MKPGATATVTYPVQRRVIVRERQFGGFTFEVGFLFFRSCRPNKSIPVKIFAHGWPSETAFHMQTFN